MIALSDVAMLVELVYLHQVRRSVILKNGIGMWNSASVWTQTESRLKVKERGRHLRMENLDLSMSNMVYLQLCRPKHHCCSMTAHF